jgi:hypothetical protein
MLLIFNLDPMEVSGQLHAMAILRPENELAVAKD